VCGGRALRGAAESNTHLAERTWLAIVGRPSSLTALSLLLGTLTAGYQRLYSQCWLASRLVVVAPTQSALIMAAAAAVRARVLTRQWDAWDAELVNLRAALADDTTKPPPPLKATPAAALTTTPPSLPLPDSGQLCAMRPPLTPEVIAQLDAATAEALGGIYFGEKVTSEPALPPGSSSSAPDVRIWSDGVAPPRP
jgi:hypothetical protein